jgi:hypothetical protein
MVLELKSEDKNKFKKIQPATRIATKNQKNKPPKPVAYYLLFN